MKIKLATLLFTIPIVAFALPTTNYPPRSAIVDWASPNGAAPTNYVVYASTNHFWQGTNMVLSPILVGQWNAGNVTVFTTPAVFLNGFTYYFVVTAQYTNGESVYSQEASVTATLPFLPPPTIHTTIQLSGSSTPVGPWDPIDLLAEYLITPDCDYAFYRSVVDIHR